MKKHNKNRLNKLKNIFYFSLSIFAIISVSFVCVLIFYGIVHRVPFLDVEKLPPHVEQYILGFVSLVIGAILSIVFRKVVTTPLSDIFYALNELSDGNYDINIKPMGIKSVRRLAKRINNTARELESVETMRNDFVNNFSHEFKTPIISISGFAKMLKSDNLTQEERNEYLNIIISESDRLAELSTNILNLSRLENQTILSNLSTFNVSEQIRLVIVLLEQKWMEKQLEIVFDNDEYMITGNEETLQQLWINLFDNAIKYAPVGSAITINAKKEQNNLIFDFTDCGDGMNDEAVKHAFEKFYQSDIAHKSTGNGIGLPMAKRICELHGGSISIKSTGKNGTTFEVVLPAEN